ncbi:U32 family peptidase [Anaerovibrio lipolyticus]|uniref:peptidase U32 family protein n=1 Tax=Anaerovibrio lipolyticus TaxID=82374 RepID=UPI001F281A74|nr:U32 family peptidase [Anaerovibrio lipolyticus]MCF2601943.1 U32 family peptidase [Anaerovibrio lipolyticus]
MKKPELLAPAGNMEKLKMALLYGADAVYLGGKAFGLRAFGGNFTNEELQEAVDFAHKLGKKIYVTVNIFPHNSDIAKLPVYLTFLNEIKVDAILVADFGVFTLAKEYAPDVELHISTQANNTNWAAVNAWAELGARRVVLAREMSLEEIKEIREKCSVELEMFVHGAMCISYSGRCLMSNYLTGRDANRGSCAQPCRWNYALVEEKRPGQYFPVLEDERGTYIFNSKDMCLLPYLPDVIASGVDSLKIEGRMKSVHYAASVVKAYREAIDSYFAAPEQFEVKKEWVEELDKVSHRAYTTGFYYGRPTEKDQIYGTSSYTQTSDFVGLVLDYDEKTGFATVEQRNNMKVGQEIEIFQPHLAGYRQILQEMYNDEGEAIQVAPHPQQIVKIRMDKPVEPYGILRRDIV